jgi:hypothetical protein
MIFDEHILNIKERRKDKNEISIDISRLEKEEKNDNTSISTRFLFLSSIISIPSQNIHPTTILYVYIERISAVVEDRH